jgi:hypothetical protein
VVLSGFQLELYSPEEKCFTYWYAARVLKAHIASVNDLLAIVDESESIATTSTAALAISHYLDAELYAELRFQHEFLSALRIMCTAMFSVSRSGRAPWFILVIFHPKITVHTPFRGRHSHSNFLRRYKWAFRPEYGDIQTPATLQPSWENFLEARTERSNVSTSECG